MTSPQPEEEGAPLGLILAALVQALISGAALAVVIALLLRLAGMSAEAVRYMFRPGPVRESYRYERPNTGTWAEPQVQQYNQNAHRRASYLVNAGRRMSRAYRSDGLEGLRKAYEAETRFWAQHLHAAQRRTDAARQVADAMARISEVRLGWYATLDERTSPECRRAHGRNFNPKRIPRIGYPGSVHPHCRCRPGVPFATRLRVEDVRPD